MGIPSKVREAIEVAPGDVREFHEMTMGGYAQLQRFVNKAPRPAFEVVDLSGPLAEAAEAIVGPLSAVDLSDDAKVKVFAEFRRQAFTLAQDQIREARWQAGQWPPDVGTPEAARVLMTADGGKVALLHVMLRQGRPETTREQAEALFEDMDPKVFYQIVAVAFGYRAEAEADGDDDPKAGSPGTDA